MWRRGKNKVDNEFTREHQKKLPVQLEKIYTLTDTFYNVAKLSNFSKNIFDFLWEP